ncbi:MAG TPA: hypothetical protein CFH81_08895 [Sulfurovum sp. UBA12169]|nr:MAG TPA: hypothetical protein CFH81_08895 [Sulfurovum sp. UBA12169]
MAKIKKIQPIIDRLMLIYEVDSRLDLCQKMDVPTGTYDTWINRDAIPKKKLIKVANEKKVNLSWIETGNGPQYTFPEPNFFTEETMAALKKQMAQTPCDGDERMAKICKAFALVDEDKQDRLLSEVLSLITSYY